jgi:serine/threonine protein kinase
MLNSPFGPYHIQDQLGVGGMAVVYRALDERTDKIVALKVLHDTLAAQEDVVARFEREAKISQRLTHPHIVTVLDYGEIDNRPYMTLEYMPNGSLARAFSQPTKVALSISARLLKQIADALDYAHKQGVVHRDLKLENILLNDKKKPILSDFGIARVIGATRLTSTGFMGGTPLYMSPEQAAGMKYIDYRADLYSFAVMAYLMATGYFPFTAREPLAVLNQHISTIPPIPSEVNPNLPPAMDAALLRGLSKLAEDRHATATDFANEFADAISAKHRTTISYIQIEGANPGKLAPSPVLPSQSKNGQPQKRKQGESPLMKIALVVVAVLIVGLGAVVVVPKLTGAAPATVMATAAPDMVTQGALVRHKGRW